MYKRIGIVTGGGDAQGTNAVIEACVTYGVKRHIKFFGFLRSWEGVYDNDYIELSSTTVKGIGSMGGTILKTSNRGKFASKSGNEGKKIKIDKELIDKVVKNYHRLNLDGIILIGGDGTLSGALQFMDRGINIIGIPKTIDNDITNTDQSFGFSSAVNIVVDAIDKVRTSAESHDRVMVIETMGRYSGWIALHSGLASGADVILLPEFDFDYNALVRFLKWKKHIGRDYSIIVVSEGAKATNGDVISDKNIKKGEIKLGGISQEIINQINKLAPNQFDLRNLVLGHLQRGGSPDSMDRILAKSYGIKAIDLILDKRYGYMVSLNDNNIVEVPITEAINMLKKVTINSHVYQTAKKLGIFMGV